MTKLARVVSFPNPNLQDIPALLRAWAAMIEEREKGAVGSVTHTVLVLNGDLGLQVIGLGSDSAASVSHVLLCAAARQLEESMLA